VTREAYIRANRQSKEKPFGSRTTNHAKQTQSPSGRLLPPVSRGQACCAPGNGGDRRGAGCTNKANPRMPCCAKQTQFREPAGRRPGSGVQNKANLREGRMNANCCSERELWRKVETGCLRKQSQFAILGRQAGHTRFRRLAIRAAMAYPAGVDGTSDTSGQTPRRDPN
jgi:hypothetical protein